MRTRVFTLAGACVFLCLSLLAYGQTSSGWSPGHSTDAPEEKDPAAILEIGASTSWNVTGGAATFAPNFAVETTPIENWLEVEAGVSPYYTHNATEWDTDLLFKKPWTLSPGAEFMMGIGPEWVYLKQNGLKQNGLKQNGLRQNGRTTNSIAGEVAGDFMFWPAHKHRFGWFLEPA
jgi:hypothetical protein